MNLPRGGGIESSKKAVERRRAAGLARRQAVAQRLVADRALEEAFEQRAQVEARASGENRKPAAGGDFRDGGARQAGVFAGGEELVGIQDIDQVMGNTATLGQRQFGSADIKVAIHLERVAVDNFSVELFRKQKCQIALSGSGGTGDCNQGSIGCVWLYVVWGICGQTPLYNENMVFEPRRGCRAAGKESRVMIRSAKALLLAVSLGCLMFGQTPAETPKTPDNKAGAYYNFAMGRVYAELAQAYGNKPDYLTKAIQHYQEALKLDPGASLVFEELTDLYIQTNHLRDAITQAEEMLKVNPDNVDARRMLGRIYMKMISTQDNRINEDYLRKAIEQLQKVTEKEPKDAESWVALGRLYRVSNNSVDAEKAYNKALEAEADNEEALTGLAQLYSDLGDNKRAIEKLKAATEKNPNERTLSALGVAYQEMHDYKNAADTLKRALEMQPDNTRLQAGLANNLMLSDRVEEALSIFEKLSSRRPHQPAAQAAHRRDLPGEARLRQSGGGVEEGEGAESAGYGSALRRGPPAGSAEQVHGGDRPAEGVGG